MLINLRYGQRGESAEWHQTIQHDGSGRPANYWATSIDEIERAGGTLHREFRTHVRTGDRLNREYFIGSEKLLIELDRWNGFTISGKSEIAKPLMESIQAAMDCM